MIRRPPYLPSFLSLPLLAALACATAPPVATELPPIVCTDGSTRMELQASGLPTAAAPLDVALSADRVWVLAEGRTLLEVPRSLAGSTRILHGTVEGPDWSALAVDRSDGSLWIVSNASFDLLRFDPRTGATLRVAVGRATGTGGFYDVAVGDGVLYLAPTCTEHGVWTVDMQGQLLDRSLPIPEDAGDRPIRMGVGGLSEDCSRAGLATGPGNAVYASHGGRVLRSGADGWQEVAELAPTSSDAVVLQGVDTGTSQESWFFERAHDFFFLGGRPVWLGGDSKTVARERRGSILFTRASDGRLEPHLERCFAWPKATASDEAGYAILTERHLIVGR